MGERLVRALSFSGARWRRLGAVLLAILLLASQPVTGVPFGGRVAAAGFPSDLTLYVGYADNLRASGFFPQPWDGSPNVNFVGCTGCTYDSGAVRIANSASSAATVDDVSVTIGTTTFDLWGSALNVPAGGSLILAQTSSSENFDTSDVGTTSCTETGFIPQITVTISGTAYTFADSEQVLNTGGFDLANCPSGTNESQPWTQLGGPLSASNVLAGGNPAAPQVPSCNSGDAVSCATGDFWETFHELAVPGRGVPLDFALTYNSLAAAAASPVGFGWTDSYAVSLAVDQTAGTATVTHENGSTVPFTMSGTSFVAPAWAPATLTQNPDGTYTFLRLHDRRSYVFSSSGQLIRIVDRNGDTTSLTYSGSQLTTVTDPAGRSLTFTYGANGDIASVTDPAGRSVSLAYDSAGDLTSITDPANGVTSFTYDSAHHALTMTDPRGGVLTNTYDPLGRVTAQTDPAGRKTTFSYVAGTTTITDPDGHVTREHFSDELPVAIERGYGTSSDATSTFTYDPSVLGITSATDPNGHVTIFTWDAQGDLLSRTDALGHTTSFTYDSQSDLTSVADPLGNTTSYTYDASGNLTGVSRPITGGGSGTQTTSFTYGDSSHPGDVTSMTDPDGNVWSFTYDTAGDLASVKDPLGDTTTYAYDAIGQRTNVVAPRGNATGANPADFTTSYTYDPLGDLTSVTDPLGDTTTYAYDADGNLLKVTDPLGHVTGYGYDADNELTSVTRADGTTLGYAYDGAGNLTGQTDAANNLTTYGYDPLNRVVSMTDPLNRTTTYAYDPAGNLTSLTNPSGQVTSFTYDAANEQTGVSYSDGTTPAVSYAYDADGRRVAMTDGTGTTSYAYNSLGELVSQTNGAGQAVGYGYDPAGNVTSLDYPNGKSATRTYDAAGRLTSVTDWLGNTTSFAYDADGNLVTTTYPNGTTATSTYDAADRMAGTQDAAGSTTLASFAYTRNADGLVASVTQGGAFSGTQSYAYDALNQLTSVNGSSYGYDAANNLTGLTSGATLAYDTANEATSLTQGGTTTPFTYDTQGNRLTGVAGSGASVTYTYDQANRLTSAQGGGSSTGAGLVAGGEYHSLAVTNTGTVYAWGNNAYGQLGNGTTTNSSTPVQVSTVTGASAVAAGDVHSAALSGRTVWTWGNNAYGQLGNGTTTNSSTPVQVSGLSGVTEVAAGNYHTLALKSDGTVWDWGLNNAGQLGTGTTTNSSTPVQVSGLSGVIAIAGGGLPGYAGHSLALKSDGTVWAWGYGKHGQLGQGSNSSSLTPVEVSGLTGVVAIAANGDDSYALKSDGTLWAWGDNSYGQLGNTSAGHTSNVPVQVAISSVSSIGAGATAAYAVKTDGTVWAWGDNNTGQLGDGAACGKTCTTPVQVSNLTSPTLVTGGYVHALAALPDGTVWAWGSNTYGQLGNGTTQVATTPVQVTGLTGVKPAPPIHTAYTCSGDGLRASEAASGVTQHFAYDLAGSIPAILTDGSTSYLDGPGGLPVEQISSSDTPAYFFHDQLGSTRLLTDRAGAVVATYSYDAYGYTTSASGSVDTAIRYAGAYFDEGAGLYYLLARTYDPATGQYLSRDPLAPITQAPYSYVGNDPLNAVDPMGLCGLWGSDTCWSGIGQALSGAVNTIGGAVSNVVHAIGGGLSSAAGTAQQAASNVTSFVAQHFVEIAGVTLAGVAIVAGGWAALGALGVVTLSAGAIGELGGFALISGGLAVYLDFQDCQRGSTVACIAMWIGGAGAAAGVPALIAPEALAAQGLALVGAHASLGALIVDMARLFVPCPE